MKKTILICLLAVFVLFVTACGNNANKPNEKAIDNQPIKQDEEQTAPDDKVEEPQKTPPSEPQEEPVEEEPQEIIKSYHMNKNYFIVPNDPADNKKVVLLTFDDGPKEEEMITEMLAILDKHDAKAIFFVNGYRVKAKPELLIQLHEAGQIIGNHAWDHINLREQTNEKIDQQIDDVQNIIVELTGEAPKFFRPPFGVSNEYVREKVLEENMLFMTWSNGSEDWVKKYQNPEGLTQRVMEQLNPGSNILMHELPWTVEALDTLLTKITDEGYSFIDPRAIHLEVGNPT